MSKKSLLRQLTGFAGLALTLSLSLAACKKDEASTAAPAVANVKLASSATLGSFLTDSVGNTLYFFA